jgi:hypothetical protein
MQESTKVTAACYTPGRGLLLGAELKLLLLLLLPAVRPAGAMLLPLLPVLPSLLWFLLGGLLLLLPLLLLCARWLLCCCWRWPLPRLEGLPRACSCCCLPGPLLLLLLLPLLLLPLLELYREPVPVLLLPPLPVGLPARHSMYFLQSMLLLLQALGFACRQGRCGLQCHILLAAAAGNAMRELCNSMPMYTTYNPKTGELSEITSHEAKQEDLAARAAAATAAVVAVAAFPVPELGVQTKTGFDSAMFKRLSRLCPRKAHGEHWRSQVPAQL